jgi:hypothetical protein
MKFTEQQWREMIAQANANAGIEGFMPDASFLSLQEQQVGKGEITVDEAIKAVLQKAPRSYKNILVLMFCVTS